MPVVPRLLATSDDLRPEDIVGRQDLEHREIRLVTLHAQVEKGPLVNDRPAVADKITADDVAAEQAIVGILVLAAPERDLVAWLAPRQVASVPMRLSVPFSCSRTISAQSNRGSFASRCGPCLL